MNILQIIHNHKFGGAEQHVISLCKGLRDAGHNVEVAAPKKSWIGQRLINAGFIVHDFDFRGHYDLWAMARLTHLAHVMHYDVIHTHLARAAFYGRIAAALTGTPLISTVHGMATWKRYPRKHPLIAVSMAVKRHLIHHGFEPERISVVFPGAKNCNLFELGDQARKKIRSELGLTDSDIAILIIARVAKIKGHDIALEAMRILRKSKENHFYLFCAGPETQWGSALRASENGKYATWLGHRDDIAELLAAADIVIQPSRSEGLGVAIMEACSAAKPMIATNVGGIPEIVEDHVNGLLIPPEDPTALADAIATISRNSDKANHFGTASQRRFQSEYSESIMLQRTINLYDSLHQRKLSR